MKPTICGAAGCGFSCEREAGHSGDHRAYNEHIDEPVFWSDPAVLDEEVTRARLADRRVALDNLIEVADSITSDLVAGERTREPGKYVVRALTLVAWRDRIISALRVLDGNVRMTKGSN